MGVSASVYGCEWGFLAREGGARAGVPEEELPAVGAGEEEGRVEGGELGGEEVGGGGVEGVFGAGVQVEVPDLEEA